MAYYRDVREYLNALEAAGKLVRIKQPINKDTEMHPLVRLQLPRTARRTAASILFEKVIDIKGRTFDIPVAVACYAGNFDIYALGMQRKKEEIYDKWARAQSHPVEPVEVQSGPCQERVISGDELKQRGMAHGGLGFCERELYHDAQEPGVCCISKSVFTQREQQNPWRRPRRAAGRRMILSKSSSEHFLVFTTK